MNKYELLNTVFAVVLIIFVVISVLKISYGTLTLLPLAYIVIYKKTKYYNWFIFFGGAMIIGIAALILLGDVNPGKEIFAISGVLLMSVLFILFGVFMPDHIKQGTDLNKIKKK